MAVYVLFDTETTGNQENDRIIQIGAMIIHSKENIELYDELCSSEVPISLEAMEVHNITPDLRITSYNVCYTKLLRASQDQN